MIKKKSNWSVFYPPHKPFAPTKPTEFYEIEKTIKEHKTYSNKLTVAYILSQFPPEADPANIIIEDNNYDAELTISLVNKEKTKVPYFNRENKEYLKKLEKYNKEMESWPQELEDWKKWSEQEKEKQLQKQIEKTKKWLKKVDPSFGK